MAFVSSFTPVTVAVSSTAFVCGTQATIAHRASSRPTVTMAANSKSVPFLPKPKETEGLVGSAEFDPFNLSKAFDIRWLQEGEIKNGRVAMLAFVGLLVQEFVHLPDKAFSSPLATEAFFQVPTGGLFQIFLFCGLCELIGHRGKVTYADMFTGDGKNRTPGELGFNPLGVKYDESMRLREIKNGRLAMLGTAGAIHQMLIYKIPIVAGLTQGLPSFPLQ